MKILLAAQPMLGHLNPLLAIGRAAQTRGDEVLVTTASALEPRVSDAGLRFIPLLPAADIDLSAQELHFPERLTLPPGPERVRFDLEHIFLDRMEPQAATLRAIIVEETPDLVIVDAFFFGATPLYLDRSRPRPPIVAYGTTFLPLDRPDGAPTGPGLPPARDDAERARYAAIARDVEAAMNDPLRAYADARLAALGLSPLPHSLWQSRVMMADAYLHPTVPTFEYDYGPLPAGVHFVGALPPPQAAAQRPDWWEDLDGARKVVLVTQGTVANDDLSQLVEPTLAALARRDDLLVVATTGGRSINGLRHPIPDNARVETFLDVEAVLSRADVLVTNGGYGTVTQALRAGVPIVAAGTSEDKSEVCARIAWFGVGLDLATSTPDADTLRTSVERILSQKSFAARAEALAADFKSIDTESVIFAVVDRLASGGWIREARD